VRQIKAKRIADEQSFRTEQETIVCLQLIHTYTVGGENTFFLMYSMYLVGFPIWF